MKYIYHFLLIFTVAVNAQEPPVHYPTPTPVWEFTKYGNTPVSEYKGLVNINIPLYTINVDNVSLPLDLNYYAGGIRVSEEAGLTGLGWSINSSIPMIVQQIKDKNDYSFSTSFQQLPPYQGNPALPSQPLCPTPGYPYWNGADPNGYYPLAGVQDIPFLRFVANSKIIDYDGHYNINNSKYVQMFEPSNGIVDKEPDIFTLHIDGRQIKFCRPEISTQNVSSSALLSMPLVILDGAGYTVNLLPSSNSQNELTIDGIMVKCPNGSEYKFTIVEKTNNGGGYYTSINYKLEEIKTFSGKLITFSYAPSVLIQETDKVNATYIRRNGNTQSGQTGTYAGAGTDINYVSGVTASTCASFGINTVQNYCEIPLHVIYEYKVLQSIKTPCESIDFYSIRRTGNVKSYRLNTIKVKNIFGREIKKFSFDYNNSDKLLSLTQDGNEPYLFEYNAIELPAKNSTSVDYWGYYNGHPNNRFRLDLTELGYPQYTENINNDFNAHIDYTKAGTLEKIIYPTKGYTIFEYELHQFDNLIVNGGSSTPVINVGGGLRIKSVTDFDFNDNIISKKSYTYFGGKCINKRVLRKESTATAGYQSGSTPYPVLYDSTPVIVTTLNNFVNQTDDSMGDYIGYDKVIIKQEGTANIGFTEKYFSNNENSCINPYNIFYCNALNYSNNADIENGNILEENIYNGSNDLLKKTKNFYFNRYYNAGYGMSVAYDHTKVYHIGDTNLGPSANTYFIPVMLATFYPIKDKKTYLKKSETSEYFNGNTKMISRNYNISPNGRIIDESAQEMAAIFQNRNMTEEHTTWSYDMPLIKTKKINSILIERQNYTYESINNYKRLKKVEVFPFANESLNNKKIYYDIYDSSNNINQYHSENGIYTCVVWGYNKTLPIAKIENIKFEQIQSYCTAIETASDTDNENALLDALGNFRTTINTQFPTSFITTYTHIPLVGVSSITDAKGNKTDYLYDDYGKLITVKNEGDIINEYEYHYKPQN